MLSWQCARLRVRERGRKWGGSYFSSFSSAPPFFLYGYNYTTKEGSGDCLVKLLHSTRFHIKKRKIKKLNRYIGVCVCGLCLIITKSKSLTSQQPQPPGQPSPTQPTPTHIFRVCFGEEGGEKCWAGCKGNCSSSIQLLLLQLPAGGAALLGANICGRQTLLVRLK